MRYLGSASRLHMMPVVGGTIGVTVLASVDDLYDGLHGLVDLGIVPGAATITLTHDGSRNFIVAARDGEGERIGSFVNVIGPYEGTRPFQFRVDEDVRLLEIEADGNWTYLIEAISALRRQICTFTTIRGSGDDVIVIGELFDNFKILDVTHDGEGNFIVASWRDSRDRLINEIGVYEGGVAPGSWTRVSDISGCV